MLSLTCLPGPTLEHSGGADTVPSPSPGLWLSPSLHCYLTTPRVIPQHLPKALLTAQPGAEHKAAPVQGQLAQETKGQEPWPQAGDILNAWQGRKDHQDLALASKGSIAQQAGGATTDTQGGEEKLLLLLPNRLSSFSLPALEQGRAVQERSQGTVGPSPAHPSLG